MDPGKTVGLVGIGLVGTAIAENLLANGFVVIGFARREVKRRELERLGGRAARVSRRGRPCGEPGDPLSYGLRRR